MSKETDFPVWVRALLMLYPRGFRRSHGHEVLEFLRLERARVERGAFARVLFWMRVCWDLLRGALRAHRSGAGARRGGVSNGAVRDSWRGVRYAGRSLARAPVFTATVVLTLGIGIGLSTSIFSVLNAVLLRPLPYADPDRLVSVAADITTADNVMISGGTLAALRDRSSVFEDVAGIATIRQNLTGPELPRQVMVGWVTPNFFSLLGVDALLGRRFERTDAMGTAMLSHVAWQRDFGGDAEVIGRSIRLDGYVYTVVGVLPADFSFDLLRATRAIDVWKVPDTWWQNGNVWGEDRFSYGIVRALARLRPGTELELARADLARLSEGLRSEVPEYAADGFELDVEPLHARIVSRARPILLLLMAAVAAVLAIVCANVVCLLLVRAEDRSREVAVRLALGAGPRRIAGHAMAESLWLALLGGGLGLVAGIAGARVLPLMAPSDVPRLSEVALDGRVLAYVAAVTLTCTLLIGVAPALSMVRQGLRTRVEGGRSTGGATAARFRGALVVAQIGASTVLLICASLLAASVTRLERIDPGYAYDGVHTFAVSLPGTRYGWPLETDQFFRRLEERIEGLPGVQSASVVWPLPLSGQRWDGSYVGGQVREEDRRLARYELITPGYFQTMDIPLLEGRDFGTDDPKVAVIVSRALADRMWPDQNAIGQRVRVDPWGGSVDFEVIGVAADAHYETLRGAPTDVFYFDSKGWAWADWEVNYVVRASGPLDELTALVRQELAALDSEIPLASPRPLASLVDAELATGRFARTLFQLFAGVAALLAGIGLYGVTSYGVRRRRREFGIRITLGASGARILGGVVRQGMVLTAGGVVIGVVGAVWAARLLRGLLFGVGTTDPRIHLMTAAGLIVVGVLSSVLPALRATRANPVDVLRPE